MDSDTTGCADLGRLILLKKAQIFDTWRHEARAVFGPNLEQSLLEDKVLTLLDVVVEALGAMPQFSQSAQQKTARAAEHGTLRAEQGFDVTQVIREFSLLRRIIREVCANEGRPLSEEALNIVVGVIDTAAAIGLGRLSERREEMAEEEAARKMSFIVHDFRTPLGAIALAATETIDAIPPETRTPAIMESLATLERNVGRLSIAMEKTIRELSTVFCDTGQLQIVKVQLYDVVAEVLEQLKTPALTKNVILSNQVDVAAELAAAPDALQRILMNLISNALRYTRDGEITISSSQTEADVEVVVRDSGRGITAEKLARIFEPGEKEPGSPGMGFGLAIAKYLVELQGGRIRIESTVGKSTAAIFTLPRMPR